MPVIPEPVAAPELMPFLRWVREQIISANADAARRQSAEGATNAAQNSTMNMLATRLGEVQASVNSIIGSATFAASQVVSGVFDPARIPTQDFSKISGGSTTVGGITVSGNATVNGHIYVPNSTIASFGSWTVAYIDGDGRLTRGASSRRFKDMITAAPTDRDYFSVPLSEFRMKGGNGQKVLGYIAEDLVGTDLERFLTFERECGPDGVHRLVRGEDGKPVPLSIDWIPMLMGQNVQLKRELDATNVRLEQVEARLSALEGTS